MDPLQGKVCLVTGATSGIGRAVALGLARQGASVVLLARDETRGQEALGLVQEVARAPAELLLADTSSLASVRRAARDFLAQHRQLHVLINAASVFLFKRQTSPDGFELMFATNHLGPFLLTELLLDALKAGAPSRILTISAPSTVPLDFNDLQSESRFQGGTAFGATKTANLLTAFAWARRLQGTAVTSNAVHPGLVRSGLMRHAPTPVRWLAHLASAPPGRAAPAIVRLASEAEYASATGRFYLRGREISAPPYTRDEAVQDRLWTVSARMAGLSA